MRFHEDGTKIDVYRRMMKWWWRIVVLKLSLGLKICKIADFLLESTAMYIVVSWIPPFCWVETPWILLTEKLYLITIIVLFP